MHKIHTQKVKQETAKPKITFARKIKCIVSGSLNTTKQSTVFNFQHNKPHHFAATATLLHKINF